MVELKPANKDAIKLKPGSKRSLKGKKITVKRSISRKSLFSNFNSKSFNRFRCWTCGLYKGDAEICRGCSHRCGLGTWIRS